MAKNIKGRKFVATAASAALVASAIVPVASAAEFADQSKISNWAADAVAHAVEKGYMQGANGNFNPQGTITKAELAQVLYNALELSPVTDAPFTDVPADAWYATAVNAIAAEGITNGDGNGKFAPTKPVTLAEAANLIVKALGLTGEADLSKFADASTVPAWANSAMQALVAGGYIKGNSNNGVLTLGANDSLSRERLATFFVAVAVDTIEKEEVTGEVVVKDLTVVGAKKLELTFENPVDAEKAVLTVKKGSINVNIDGFKFADDKKSVVITTTTNLSKGDYTVTLSGLTKEPISKTVTAADEKVSKINVLSQTAPMNATATSIDSVTYAANQSAFVNYEVLNQYGEKMKGQTITWTQSTGGKIYDNTTTNTLTIGNTAAGQNFIPGAKVYLTGVHGTTATVVNAEVTIGLPSHVASVEIAGVYDRTTSKFVDLPADFANGRYVLLFNTKDQYGNDIQIASADSLTVLSDNPLFIAQPQSSDFVSSVTVGEETYAGFELTRGQQPAKGGTANIQIISNNTGKTASYTIKADAVAAVTSFQISAPADLIAGGEKVEIPFTALDQYGNAVTKHTALLASVNLNATAGTLKLEQQKDGSSKLFFYAADNFTNFDTIVSLTSTLTGNGNYSNVQVSVKPNALPSTVVGLDSEVSTYIAKGSELSLSYEDLLVQDQYGRTMDTDLIAAWLDKGVSGGDNAIVLESNAGATTAFEVTSTKVTNDAELVYITTSADTFTVAARSGVTSSANETLKFSLSTTTTPTAVTTSSKSLQFTAIAQAAYVSYELAELGTMYNDGNATNATNADYAKTVKVYGITESGAKVLLPTSMYSVSTTSTKVSVNGNVISDVATGGFTTADFAEVLTGAAKTQTVKVTVMVNDSVGAAAAVLTQDLVVTNAKPVAETFKLSTLVSNGSAFVSDTTGTISTGALTGYITQVKDQYGVTLAATPSITVSNVVKASTTSAFKVINNATDTASITGATAGDKFTVTYTYAGGKTVTINFIVAAN